MLLVHNGDFHLYTWLNSAQKFQAFQETAHIYANRRVKLDINILPKNQASLTMLMTNVVNIDHSPKSQALRTE